MGLRDKILQAADIKREGPLVIPEWEITADDQLYLRVMKGTERNAFENLMSQRMTKDGKVADCSGFMARVLVWCLVDAAGNQVFDGRDISALEAKSAAVIRRLYQQAMELSGMTPVAQAEAKEELKKTDDSDSSTDWLSVSAAPSANCSTPSTAKS